MPGGTKKRGRSKLAVADHTDEDYTVKRVVGHKLVDNSLYYLLQWEDDNSFSWLPKSSLNCPDLIEEYHDRCKVMERIRNDWYENTIVKTKPYPVGFNRGLEVDYIFTVQMLEVEREIVCVVLFKDCDELDLVPYAYVKELAPMALIAFFERAFKVELTDGRIMRLEGPGDYKLREVDDEWEQSTLRDLLHDYSKPFFD